MRFLVAVAAFATVGTATGLLPAAQAQGGPSVARTEAQRAGAAPSTDDAWTAMEEFQQAYPLHFALSTGLYNEALELMRFQKNLDAHDSNGNTPLTLAASIESTAAFDMVQALLRLGANPDAYDGGGLMALHHAARVGTLSVVQILADTFGAEVDAVPAESSAYDSYFTPLYCARVAGHDRIVDFLESRGARLEGAVSEEAAFEARITEILGSQPYDSKEFQELPEAERSLKIRQDTRAAVQVAFQESGATAEAQAALERIFELLDSSEGATMPPGMTEEDWLTLRYTQVLEQLVREHSEGGR